MVRTPSLAQMAALAVVPVALMELAEKVARTVQTDSIGTERTETPEKAKAPLPESLVNLVGNCMRAVVVDAVLHLPKAALAVKEAVALAAIRVVVQRPVKPIRAAVAVVQPIIRLAAPVAPASPLSATHGRWLKWQNLWQLSMMA